jgi:glycosyltransferase involved in cell wall biosynthesis
MIVGIFSKFEVSGGSEFRCIEMANSIARHTPHKPILFAEGRLLDSIRQRLMPEIEVRSNVFKPEPNPENIMRLYDVDTLLTVNTDSYSFSKLDYWEGRTEHHKCFVDLTKIKQMAFLYNFVISPSTNLPGIEEKCKDIRILVGNKRFMDEINGKKDKLRVVQHYPRMLLHSPIDVTSVDPDKDQSNKIRIGKHSKAYGNKFNSDHAKLIRAVNERYGDKIVWDFLGVPGNKIDSIKDISNVIIRKEFSISVKQYLRNIDIFLFYLEYDRIEPWSRSTAEAMVAGCPIIANNRGGNIEQILPGSNGYLCNGYDDFLMWTTHLLDNPDKIKLLGRNAQIYAKQFKSEKIINQFFDFIA